MGIIKKAYLRSKTRKRKEKGGLGNKSLEPPFGQKFSLLIEA